MSPRAAEPETAEPLRAQLLAGASSEAPRRAWHARLEPGLMLLSSAFIVYHLLVLVLWNSSPKGLSDEVRSTLLERSHAHAYFRGSGNAQSWGMFAPNPNRTNTFIRVSVQDAQGQSWDLDQDIWGRERWPYLWYDRGGKANRRLDANKTNQRIWGAWVCREWERRHGGEAAQSVSFVRLWTRVPEPERVLELGGWDPWAQTPKQLAQETVPCATTEQAQLNNELRRRYGLPEIDEQGRYRPVRLKSWWDEQEAERLDADKRRERDAARKRWQAQQAAREAARQDD